MSDRRWLRNAVDQSKHPDLVLLDFRHRFWDGHPINPHSNQEPRNAQMLDVLVVR